MRKKQVLVVLTLFWLFYAIGFIFMGGIIDVVLGVFQGEGRQLLCGTDGCRDLEYYLSLIWLWGQVLIIVGIPLVMVYVFVKNKRTS